MGPYWTGFFFCFKNYYFMGMVLINLIINHMLQFNHLFFPSVNEHHCSRNPADKYSIQNEMMMVIQLLVQCACWRHNNLSTVRFHNFKMIRAQRKCVLFQILKKNLQQDWQLLLSKLHYRSVQTILHPTQNISPFPILLMGHDPLLYTMLVYNMLCFSSFLLEILL